LGSANSLFAALNGNSDNSLNEINPIEGAFNRFGVPVFGLRLDDLATSGARTNKFIKDGLGDARSAWGNATKQTGLIDGVNSVNGRNINPDAYGSFGKGGIEGYYGQKFFGQFPQRDFQKTEVPKDSALNGIQGVDTKKLWNEVRSNLIGGVFADDQHLNTALNSTLEKFGGADSKYQETIKNADSLSVATAFNISDKGINEHGIGSMMEAYSKIDNYIPEGMITRDYLNAFQSKLNETGSVAEALKSAKQFDTKDHGLTDPNVSSNDTKALAHTINEASYRDMATSMGLNPDKLLNDYARNNGFNEANSLYQLSGAQHLASTLDSNLTKMEANGKTGFQNLVDRSETQHGGEFKGDLNVSIVNSSNNNTDGEAFASTEGGLSGQAGLIKHIAGLTDNPITGNHFNLAYQGDAERAKAGISDFIDKGHEAGVKFDRINLTVKGHGSEDGSTMLASGVSDPGYKGADAYKGMGVQDSAYFKNILAKTPELKELNITYDSCFGLKSAQANAAAAQQAAKDLGMNIKVNYTGSQIEGLVDSHQINKYDDGFGMVKANADGGLSVSHQRMDDGGSQQSGTLYSQGEEAYAQRMKTEQNSIEQPKNDTQLAKRPIDEESELGVSIH
jgi:hypothetical protein